jgi:hypothetical protein
MPTLIVFCHLRWDFVFQRPQHLMTRLAEHYRILFVEEPVYHEGQAHLKKTAVAPNITVMPAAYPASRLLGLPRRPAADPADAAGRPGAGRRKAGGLVLHPDGPAAAAGFDPALVVYDCMDELAAFKNAPKQLLQRETRCSTSPTCASPAARACTNPRKTATRTPTASRAASTPSTSSRRSTKRLQPSRAGPRRASAPGLLRRDRRALRYRPVRQVAAARPEWQIVLVGPVVKIDPANLPRANNIHYMGQRNYESCRNSWPAGTSACCRSR